MRRRFSIIVFFAICITGVKHQSPLNFSNQSREDVIEMLASSAPTNVALVFGILHFQLNIKL